MICRESARLPAGHEKSAKILRQFRRECPPVGDFLLVGFRYWPGTSGLACRNKRRSCAAAVSRQSLLQPGCRHGYGVGTIRVLYTGEKDGRRFCVCHLFALLYVDPRSPCLFRSKQRRFLRRRMHACLCAALKRGGRRPQSLPKGQLHFDITGVLAREYMLCVR